jgi:hypothetical protein
MEIKLEQKYVDEAFASTITGMSPAWFQRARWAGHGPPFVGSVLILLDQAVFAHANS